MGYDFDVRDVDPLPVLFVRGRVKLDEIESHFKRALPAVNEFMQKNGIEMAGPPFGRYECIGEDGFLLDAGCPVAGTPEGGGDVEAGVLEGGRSLVSLVKGPYTQLPAAWKAGEAYMEEHELTPRAAPYELYVTDPGEHEDPADWQTLIVRPIE